MSSQPLILLHLVHGSHNRYLDAVRRSRTGFSRMVDGNRPQPVAPLFVFEVSDT